MILFENSSDIVMKKTGYAFGTLYDMQENELKANNSSYDDVSCNFHIISDNIGNLSQQIQMFREDLKCLMVEDSSFAVERSIKAAKCVGDRAVYIYSMGGKSSLKVDPSQVEKYLAIYYKNFVYMICFEQMYADKEKISCKLGKIQYYRCLMDKNDKMKNINIDANGKFDLCYPSKKQIILEKPDGRKVINSNGSIRNKPEEILNEIKKHVLEM